LSLCLLFKNIYITIILPVVLFGFETWSVTFEGGAQTGGVQNGAEENMWY